LESIEGIGGHCLPKDTKMSLESSNRRRSKILTAAMDTDEDYKKFRTKLEKGIKSAAGKWLDSQKPVIVMGDSNKDEHIRDREAHKKLPHHPTSLSNSVFSETSYKIKTSACNIITSL
jgi:UDP-glucose 6-dehydrogenase